MNSYNTINTNNIPGIPLSINNSGLLGLTPSVSKTFLTGINPSDIAIVPNGSTAYVANSDNYGLIDSVSVLNLETGLTQTNITDSSFNAPYTVTINSEGTIAYITNSNSPSTLGVPGTITKIDILTNTVIGTLGTLLPVNGGLDGPNAMVLNGNIAYINNYGAPAGATSGFGSSVSVMNVLSGSLITTITVGQAPAANTISPNNAYVYVANYVDGNPGNGTVSVIQTSNNTVIGTITGFSGPYDIQITPDGSKGIVTNFGSNNFVPFGSTVSIFNTANNTIIQNISVGIQPSGLAIDPSGQYAFISNYNTLYAYTILPTTFTNLTAGSGTISIIDINNGYVVAPTILVGLSPSAIAIGPSGDYMYVTNYTSNTVNEVFIGSLTQ
jgi:YVTN family beta-propeller protein